MSSQLFSLQSFMCPFLMACGASSEVLSYLCAAGDMCAHSVVVCARHAKVF